MNGGYVYTGLTHGPNKRVIDKRLCFGTCLTEASELDAKSRRMVCNAVLSSVAFPPRLRGANAS